MFVDILIGRHPLLGDNPKYDFSPTDKELVSDNIKYIAFRDTYGGDNDRTYFLQQRWNQTEIDEATVTARQKLDSGGIFLSFYISDKDSIIIRINSIIHFPPFRNSFGSI